MDNENPVNFNRDTLIRRGGSDVPLSELMDDKGIHRLNTTSQMMGQDPDEIVFGTRGPSVTTLPPSDPAQETIDHKHREERIKALIAERGGEMAVARATDENGNLRWD